LKSWIRPWEWPEEKGQIENFIAYCHTMILGFSYYMYISTGRHQNVNISLDVYYNVILFYVCYYEVWLNFDNKNNGCLRSVRCDNYIFRII
jgi:hypothetical protein